MIIKLNRPIQGMDNVQSENIRVNSNQIQYYYSVKATQHLKVDENYIENTLDLTRIEFNEGYLLVYETPFEIDLIIDKKIRGLI